MGRRPHLSTSQPITGVTTAEMRFGKEVMKLAFFSSNMKRSSKYGTLVTCKKGHTATYTKRHVTLTSQYMRLKLSVSRILTSSSAATPLVRQLVRPLAASRRSPSLSSHVASSAAASENTQMSEPTPLAPTTPSDSTRDGCVLKAATEPSLDTVTPMPIAKASSRPTNHLEMSVRLQTFWLSPPRPKTRRPRTRSQIHLHQSPIVKSIEPNSTSVVKVIAAARMPRRSTMRPPTSGRMTLGQEYTEESKPNVSSDMPVWLRTASWVADVWSKK
mmetsp:Transcript_138418/g.336416  ORF Transcript_138418/g.336416 Transcript_138418/m.336416 type:complete len:273 (+) Transcript_138418:668-1486(+)